MYKNPIEKIYGELHTQIVQEDEKMVMKAIREVGVNVDKGELIKALQYDRNQYTKGYEDCKNEVLTEIRAEIEQIQGKKHRASDEFGNYYTYETIDKADVLEIIDKYQKRSEE